MFKMALKDAEESARYKGNIAKVELGMSRELIHSPSK